MQDIGKRGHEVYPLEASTRIRPYEIKYFIIEVQNPYHEDLIELNPTMSAFFELEDVLLTVFLVKMTRF